METITSVSLGFVVHKYSPSALADLGSERKYIHLQKVQHEPAPAKRSNAATPQRAPKFVSILCFDPLFLSVTLCAWDPRTRRGIS